MKLSQFVKTTALVLGIALSILATSLMVLAWAPPTAAPPTANAPAPINVGATAQTRTGQLSIMADLFANRLLDSANSAFFIDPASTGISGLFAGNVGIGTTAPTAPLTVVGNVLAATNVHDACSWGAWTCADQQACASGFYVTAIERGAASGAGLCGVAPRQWYQMRTHCCQI